MRKHRCPCGDEQCYIEPEGFEEEELVEQVGVMEPNFDLGSPKLSLNSNKVAAPPYVGQSFQSDEEALEYYSNFARNNGFLVRRERSKGNPEHPMGVYKRELVCHRPAPLYPYISQADRERILALAKGGCNANLIIRALEMEKGIKPGQLTFGERDLKNFLNASMSINPENEGLELLKACKVMKERNPDFRYEFTYDESNKLEHIAWSYVGSIQAYKIFGDVVFFDTTYHLYAYDRIVGVWFGLDNNGNTIFFCCAVLLDEKPDSYRWAFQAFLRLMDGKLPQTILTDFDLGLKDALTNELPSAKHAFSIWHIMSKLPANNSMATKFFFKGFLNSQTRLKDFTEQVGVAVDFQNQAGEEAATQQSQESLKIKTCLPSRSMRRLS
uniref:Protein FAR1-RELATED SEQUENCE n=1 Tax=Ananas comosus var. bracteatus TaxID=296719 RepID=A0A6V7NUD7_ANACO|nr:unnamed protein product [Ananas comosus var. bracteatus]